MNNLIQISEIYYNNALELVKKNKISKAVNLIEQGLKYYAKDIQFLNLMGICQYILCNFDKAYFYWQKSLEFNTENNRAGYYLENLESDSFKSVIKKYNLAIESINKNEYKNAISILEVILQLNKELVEPYAIIGLCYYKINNYKLAREYIQKAISIDKENTKYLIYLNEINSKNIPTYKYKIFNSNAIGTGFVILSILAVTLYSKISGEYKQLSNQVSEYQNKIYEYSVALDTSNTKYDEIKSELEKQKTNFAIFSGYENVVFDSAILDFKNQNYSQAVDKFQYILNNCHEENLVAESTYFLGVCYEKNSNYNLAESYYCTYINNFQGQNYYDDSLYNYGLMLYRQGDNARAYEVLTKLEKITPESIFLNSKVKYILDNYKS